MKEEIKKMSDTDLLEKIMLTCSILNRTILTKRSMKYTHDNLYIAKQELLKRLQNNNIEEFKKKLLEEIEYLYKNNLLNSLYDLDEFYIEICKIINKL